LSNEVTQNKLDKVRKLSLGGLNEYPHQKLLNLTNLKNFRHGQRISKKDVVRRQNSAPEQRQKPLSEIIIEEDEKQLNDQLLTNQINLTENNQPLTINNSKFNQIRSKRKQARFRTQPITFDEIKEVDEECFNEIQPDNSINKLINLHISDNIK
jgi:hypothetical protein